MRHSSRFFTQSKAFTLVELLVVITIIGILVGLLLPGVQMAREAGRRTVCENNLKQLSTGVKGYESKLGFYPSGGWGSSWAGTPADQNMNVLGDGPGQPGGWIYQILPMVDNGALHDLGLPGLTTSSGTSNTTRLETALTIFNCPTRRPAQPYSYNVTLPHMCTDLSGSNSISVVGAARADYAINGGSNYVPYSNYTLPTTAPPPTSFVWPQLPPSTFNGLSYVHSQVTDGQLHRGQSNTYMLGEKFMYSDHYDGSDPGDLQSAYSGDDLSLVRWGYYVAGSTGTNLVPSRDTTLSYVSINPLIYPQAPIGAKIFGSAHGAGWHAAFCDGQVRMLSFNIDGFTHQQLADRSDSDHQPVDPTKIR